MSHPEQKKSSRWKAWAGRLLLAAIVWLIFLPFILALIGEYAFQIPYHVLAGWFFHLRDAVLPAIGGRFMALGLPLVCLAVALAMAHRFFIWLGKGKPWNFGKTLSIGGLILLGSAAAIAASGVLHQLFWMTKEPLVTSSHRSARMAAISDMRQLGFAMFEFHTERDRFPETMDELFDSIPGAERWRMIRSPNGPKEPVMLVTPPETNGNPSNPILAVYLDWVMIVVHEDSSVSTMDVETLKTWVADARSR